MFLETEYKVHDPFNRHLDLYDFFNEKNKEFKRFHINEDWHKDKNGKSIIIIQGAYLYSKNDILHKLNTIGMLNYNTNEPFKISNHTAIGEMWNYVCNIL